MCAHEYDQSPDRRESTFKIDHDELESTTSLEKENERLQQEVGPWRRGNKHTLKEPYPKSQPSE